MARGPKARDYDYSNVGTQGRRTGITLKEGRRDEYGMEELDGVFSSPEKSPMRSPGIYTGNDTIVGSEGMSMDEDSAPGPSDFLTRRSPYLPPPVARSPRKSGLGGSPRRTPGLRSSPIAQDERRSSSPSTLPRRGSRANATARPPLNDRRPNTASAPVAKQKSREIDANGDFSDNENNPVLDDEEEEIQDESAFENDFGGDVDVHVDDDFGGDSDGSIEDVGAGHADISEQDSPSVHASNSRTINRRSVSARRSRDTDEEDDAPAEPPSGNKLKRGRSGKSKAQDSNSRPAKKAKPSKTTAPPEPLDPELEKVVENHVSRTGPLKGRSLYILKRETPSEEQSTHTRSGRVSVRPLAYWRNERCIYGDGEANLGQRYPLSTIKEIIRTEELQPEKTKKKRKRGKQSKKQDDDSDEDPGEPDEWEKDRILYGYAKKWDSDRQTSSKEEEAIEIAYASHNVETREVKDSTFRLGKLLSYSFIGSGIVEIPPKGVKKPKNSKRMHMVFYVSHGRVQVDVNGVQFTAGKGCVFQVPRGNHYSFANTYKANARLFFTQAFIPGDGEDADTGEAGTGETSAADSEAPLPKRGRGRGKKAVQE